MTTFTSELLRRRLYYCHVLYRSFGIGVIAQSAPPRFLPAKVAVLEGRKRVNPEFTSDLGAIEAANILRALVPLSTPVSLTDHQQLLPPMRVPVVEPPG